MKSKICKNLNLVWLFAIVFIIQSCATVNIASNKLSSYNKQPKKLYILVNCDKKANVFCDGLIHGLSLGLRQKGIEFESEIHDPLSLETEETINKKIQDYKPEAVLSIHQTVTGYGRGTFELTLVDLETHKNVWKSEFDVSSDSSLDDEEVIAKSVTKLVNKLVEDKII